MINLSPGTLQALRLAGEGPPVVKLSSRRIGYPVDGLKGWVAQRTTASADHVGGLS